MKLIRQLLELDNNVQFTGAYISVMPFDFDAAVKALEDEGFIHDSPDAVSDPEHTAMRKTGKMFRSSTVEPGVLWVTPTQKKHLFDLGHLSEDDEDVVE